MEISEKAPAKLNFSLDTPFRHPDGNPEWKMVMIAVDLADYVHIKTKTDSKDITVRTDTGFLPCDERNLAFQAAKKLQHLFHKNERFVAVPVNLYFSLPYKMYLHMFP